MKTSRIHRTVFAIGLAVLSLSILVSSSARTSQAFTTTTVFNATQNEALDFSLVNETGYSIKRVYIGPSNNPEWTDDMEVLRGRTFKSGAALDITFSPKARSAKWDLRVEWAAPYEKDPPVNWYGLDLTEIEKLTLLYNADTGKTSVRKN
ncbi:MAG TPA: hypothetical protein VF544_19630 [Pyrinomonadaceae bacterium]|jgi:hypothetical protein